MNRQVEITLAKQRAQYKLYEATVEIPMLIRNIMRLRTPNFVIMVLVDEITSLRIYDHTLPDKEMALA